MQCAGGAQTSHAVILGEHLSHFGAVPVVEELL